MLPCKESSEIDYADLVAQVVSASVASISFNNQGTMECMWERKKSSENDSLCTELSVKAIRGRETTDP